MMRFKFCSLTTIGLLLSTPVWTPVQARGLKVDTSVPQEQRPKVSAIKGVPVVNIAPLSKGGVSNNRYTTFNVGTEGVVLDNSVGAAVILNQVTAKGDPSQLRGPLEVRGAAARVIVANPNGIVCDGCGFLNTNSVMLTTGKPKFNNDDELDALTHVEVTSGMLTIEGQGLNDEQTPRVDLVAYSLKLDKATIRANVLNIVGGSNSASLGTNDITGVTAIDAASDAPPPQVTLGKDGQGGIYVKKGIRAVVTNAGVGMNIGNDLVVQGGNLRITVLGNVHILPTATVSSTDALDVQTGGDLNIGGQLSSGKQISLTVRGNATVTGMVNAAGPVNLKADQTLQVSRPGPDQFMPGAIVSSDNVHLDAKQDLRVEGAVSASKALQLTAGDNLYIMPRGWAQSDQQLTMTAKGGVFVTGQVYTQPIVTDATGNLTMNAGQNIGIGRNSRITASGWLVFNATERILFQKGAIVSSGAGYPRFNSGHGSIVSLP